MNNKLYEIQKKSCVDWSWAYIFFRKINFLIIHWQIQFSENGCRFNWFSYELFTTKLECYKILLSWSRDPTLATWFNLKCTSKSVPVCYSEWLCCKGYSSCNFSSVPSSTLTCNKFRLQVAGNRKGGIRICMVKANCSKKSFLHVTCAPTKRGDEIGLGGLILETQRAICGSEKSSVSLTQALPWWRWAKRRRIYQLENCISRSCVSICYWCYPCYLVYPGLYFGDEMT